MPRNEVIERMAKKVHRVVNEEAGPDLAVPWEDLSRHNQETYYNDALELLAIIEANCETLNFPTPDGVDVFIVANTDLVDAFQLVQEAKREVRHEKGGNDSPNPGSKASR